MQTLPIIYLVYMFISLYFLLLIILIYIKNRGILFFSPVLTKHYGVSFLVPAFNESKTVIETIKHLYEIDYDNVIEIIVINDGSTDNTLDVLKEQLAFYRGRKIKLILLNKKNTGKADSLNKALKFAKGEIVIVVDADSYPAKNCLKNILGYFDDSKVGSATAPCIARNQSNFLEKVQGLEYRVISFSRKLLEFIDSIYVIPGPLGVYRKKALEDIGGFDTKNMTEDIEATWHLQHRGWKVKMCLNTSVCTTVPNKFKTWFRQRRRWNMGGLQCLNKYKSMLFRRNMLGRFIVPFFALGYALGLFGLAVWIYVASKTLFSRLLIVRYGSAVNLPGLTMDEIFITPSVINYFGAIIFVLFVVFTIFVLSVVKDNIAKKESFFNFLFYMLIYVLAHPVLLIIAIYGLIIGKKVWR